MGMTPERRAAGRSRGRPIDRGSWPKAGPHLDLLKLLDALRHENATAESGMRSLVEIGHILNVGKTRVSDLLGGKDPPADAPQAKKLIEAVGGSAEDVEKGLKYFRLMQLSRTANRKPSVRSGSSKRRRDDQRQQNYIGARGASGIAELEARVHTAAELSIPYIRRDVEDEVKDFLEQRKPVLLAGSSMVGKTRMAATLIEELVGNRSILIPDSKEELVSLGAAASQIQDSIIFLDDIDRLIGDKGIVRADLARLAERNIIIGTIRAAIYDGFLPTDRIRAPQGDILSIFELVIMDRALSANEKIRLLEAVRDPKLCRRIWRAGLGEYVGGARRITEALRLGRAACPIGLALVQGAADWSRAGITVPTPASLLPALAVPHLDERGRVAIADKHEYGKALEWATCVISPTVSLLQREQGDCFSVFDYALDLLADRADPIPEATWPILMDNTAPADLNNIGLTAAASGNRDVAQMAWRRSEETGGPDSAPFAALYLGTVLAEQGDTKDALAAFRRAVDSRHADAAPSAAVSLGDLLSKQGDPQKARKAYQQAISYQHFRVTPEAELSLGNLLAAQGDLAGAQAAYQRALDSDLDIAEVEAALTEGKNEAGPVIFVSADNPYDLPDPKVLLAEIMARMAEHPGQDVRPQIVFFADTRSRRPDPGTIALAANNLGALRAQQGDMQGAQEASLRAARALRSGSVPEFSLNLGNMLVKRGEMKAAIAAYKEAIDSGDEDVAPEAMVQLGIALRRIGEISGAEQSYRQAIDSGNSKAVPLAAFNLAALLEIRGDMDGARDAYQLVVQVGSGVVSRKAADRLKNLRGSR